MSNYLDDRYYGKWWLKSSIDWSNIGSDVVNRPTEITAFNNIANEIKSLQKLNKWSIEFTKEEIYVLRTNLEVLDKNFDYSKYKEVYRKDSTIRKISKITSFSEMYVMRSLNSISHKLYLLELLGYEGNVYDVINSNYNNK